LLTSQEDNQTHYLGKYLSESITNIDRVSEWAAAMGYDDQKTFSRHIQNRFGKSPKKLMVEVKLDILKNLLN